MSKFSELLLLLGYFGRCKLKEVGLRVNCYLILLKCLKYVVKNTNGFVAGGGYRRKSNAS